MRAWTIKRQGKTIWQNVMTGPTLHVSDGKAIWVNYLFFRKRDAVAYMNAIGIEHYEVIGLTIDKSQTDNRKK